VVRSFSKVVLGIWGLTALQDRAADERADHERGRSRYRTRRAALLWDTVPEELGVPVQRQAGTTDESGRGLELLDALSATWGWEPVPGRAVKKVWAELRKPVDEDAAGTAS
jgi:hypothetical protein